MFVKDLHQTYAMSHAPLYTLLVRLQRVSLEAAVLKAGVCLVL